MHSTPHRERRAWNNSRTGDHGLLLRVRGARVGGRVRFRRARCGPAWRWRCEALHGFGTWSLQHVPQARAIPCDHRTTVGSERREEARVGPPCFAVLALLAAGIEQGRPDRMTVAGRMGQRKIPFQPPRFRLFASPCALLCSLLPLGCRVRSGRHATARTTRA